jgi:Cu/Zn superoxide dismutase
MSTFARIAAALTLSLALLAFAGCGGDDEESADEVTVELAAVGDSGQTGTVTLTAEGDQTRVVIEVDEPVSASQPAHIHEGTCDDLNPTPEHGLQNVDDGQSDTTVEASLEELQEEPYAINLHMSADDLETYTSCGDIG